MRHRHGYDSTAELRAGDAARALLLAYLPRTLVEHWARDPEGAPVWQDTLKGSLMHCDMSGFTAMSERLARLGKEGAELMAGVLNRFFDRMLLIADGWGGLQIKFGGDAMLLFFDGDAHAHRAAACALDMQRAMPEFRAVEAGGEKHRLRMRAGIHSGRFFSVSAGDPEGLLHYLLIGPDVSRTAAVEAGGSPGQVVVSNETASLLRDDAQLTAAGDLWRLRSAVEPPRPAPRIDVSGAPAAVLQRYLMPPLAVPLSDAREPHFAAEHRRVTAVFVNVLGVAELLESAGGETAAMREVDAYLKLVFAALERHGGFLAGSDAAEHGDKLIVLFGAPVSAERDEASALRFALELDAELAASGLTLRHQIGVSTGSVFAGEIGSTIRREYTVIGDSVNLSARLMAAAPRGATYVSQPTVARAGDAFTLAALKPMSVKGKAAPVRAYRLEGIAASPAITQRGASTILLGRDEEMARMLAVAREIRRGARWTYVFGEPGIGKSAFIDALVARLTADGWRCLAAYGQAHRSRDVFAAWQTPLHSLFGITGDHTPEEAWRRLDAAVGRLAPDMHPFASILAGVLGIPAEEGPLVRFLDARTRRQHLTTLIRESLAAAARETPVVLTFEDAHLCDDPSLELLAEAIDGLRAPVLVCVTSRSTLAPDALRAADPALALELTELGSDAARALAASTVSLPEDQLNALLERARGNPLFVQELALSGTRDADMPETVNDVIMARLDRLAGDEKSVLRAASVVGASFDTSHVRTLLGGRLDLDMMEHALAGLAEAGFTLATEDPATHSFRHPLTQEVLYDTLPFVQRRSLHGKLAHEIERESAGQLAPVAGLLLHHFDRAGDAPKTVVYAALSGDRASQAYANREAIDYYTRGLSALDAASKGSASDRSLLLERIGQCLETQGRHAAAAEALLDALARWRERRAVRARRLLDSAMPDAARESALCRRIAVSLERNSAYDEALRWLDDALSVLPARAGRIAAEVHASKSVTLYRKGEYREAIDCGRRALVIARRGGEPDVVAYAENMVAQSYLAEGSLREAVRHMREAVRLYGQIGDVPGQAAANNNLGGCYQLMGMLDAARRHYTVALEADERVGDLVDIAIIHNNVAEIMLIQGEYAEAVGHLERVFEAHRAEGALTGVAGLSYVNLGRCALAQGDPAAAERHVRHGMRLVRGVGEKGLVTEARMQLAEVLLAAGDLAAAQRQGQRALNDAQAAGERLLEARGERIIGLVRDAGGAVDSAAIHFATSAGLARRIGATHEEARSLLALARLRVHTGGRPRTTGLRRALSIFTRMNAAPEIAEAERLLAKLEGATATGDAGSAPGGSRRRNGRPR